MALRVRRPRRPHLEGVVVLARGRVVQRGVVEVAAEVVLEDARVFVEGVAVQVGVLREVRRGRGTVGGEVPVSLLNLNLQIHTHRCRVGTGKSGRALISLVGQPLQALAVDQVNQTQLHHPMPHVIYRDRLKGLCGCEKFLPALA